MKKRKGRQAIAVLLGGIMLCSLSMGAVSTPVHAQEAEEEAQAAQDTGGGGIMRLQPSWMLPRIREMDQAF